MPPVQSLLRSRTAKPHIVLVPGATVWIGVSSLGKWSPRQVHADARRRGSQEGSWGSSLSQSWPGPAPCTLGPVWHGGGGGEHKRCPLHCGSPQAQLHPLLAAGVKVLQLLVRWCWRWELTEWRTGRNHVRSEKSISERKQELVLGLSGSGFGAVPGVRRGPCSAPMISQLERGTTQVQAGTSSASWDMRWPQDSWQVLLLRCIISWHSSIIPYKLIY